jgi:hypothetical protein
MHVKKEHKTSITLNMRDIYEIINERGLLPKGCLLPKGWGKKAHTTTMSTDGSSLTIEITRFITSKIVNKK